ncbi:MAG: hypothetical protein AAGE65_10795 [Planctomycetota bacterium]
MNPHFRRLARPTHDAPAKPRCWSGFACGLALLFAAPLHAATIQANGTGFTQNGGPYRAIGVNYYDAFLRHLRDADDTTFAAGLQDLGDAGIPFARFNAGGFRTNDWTLYQNDPDEYFTRMDRVFDAAHASGVQLIPTVFWRFEFIADANGETPDAWNDNDSATRAFARRYADDVVARYHDHPALLMWEFGNEFNLFQDLPEAANRPADQLITSDAVRAAVAEFTGIVRTYDETVAVTTGHSVARAAAQTLRDTGDFGRDTAAQFAQVTADDHADVDTISVHAYYHAFIGRDRADVELPSVRFDQDLSDDTPGAGYLDVLHELVAISEAEQKPLFFGEFGVPDDYASPVPGTDENPDSVEDQFRFVLDALVNAQVPLSAIWVYDRDPQFGNGYNLRFDNDRADQLDALVDANRRLTRVIPEPNATPSVGAALVFFTRRYRPRD